MTSNQNNNNNINPRPCVYGCGIQIYWNASVNEYWEVLTKKRHICPNIVSNKNKTSITPPSNAPKPYYYHSTKKASFSSANPKPLSLKNNIQRNLFVISSSIALLVNSSSILNSYNSDLLYLMIKFSFKFDVKMSKKSFTIHLYQFYLSI